MCMKEESEKILRVIRSSFADFIFYPDAFDALFSLFSHQLCMSVLFFFFCSSTHISWKMKEKPSYFCMLPETNRIDSAIAVVFITSSWEEDEKYEKKM